MIPPRFEYHAPTSVGEAVTLLGQLGDEAKLLAGGHSLLPMMKLRFARPGHLIDINRIAALRGIRESGSTIAIGAMTTESALIASPILQAKVPLLAAAAKLIADPQVRNRGTIGGDIAHGDPANDHPALSLVCDAQFVLEGPKGRRTVAANGFFLGIYTTRLEASEMIVEICMPAFRPNTGWAYEKLKRKAGDWATAGCAVVMCRDGQVISHIRIGLTNVAQTALRVQTAEAMLLGKPFTPDHVHAAAQAAMQACDPSEDLRGNVEYKTAMTGEMVKRALHKAWARCQ